MLLLILLGIDALLWLTGKVLERYAARLRAQLREP